MRADSCGRDGQAFRTTEDVINIGVIGRGQDITADRGIVIRVFDDGAAIRLRHEGVVDRVDRDSELRRRGIGRICLIGGGEINLEGAIPIMHLREGVGAVGIKVQDTLTINQGIRVEGQGDALYRGGGQREGFGRAVGDVIDVCEVGALEDITRQDRFCIFVSRQATILGSERVLGRGDADMQGCIGRMLRIALFDGRVTDASDCAIPVLRWREGVRTVGLKGDGTHVFGSSRGGHNVQAKGRTNLNDVTRCAGVVIWHRDAGLTDEELGNLQRFGFPVVYDIVREDITRRIRIFRRGLAIICRRERVVGCGDCEGDRLGSHARVRVADHQAKRLRRAGLQRVHGRGINHVGVDAVRVDGERAVGSN